VGGFDGTSNVLAGKLTGIDVKGTHAHAYIMCYSSLSELHETTIGIPATTLSCVLLVPSHHHNLTKIKLVRIV
jgi:nicotinate phosphoribosyltransferase